MDQWRKPLRVMVFLLIAICTCFDGLLAELAVAGEFRGCILHVDAQGRWTSGAPATATDYLLVFGFVLIQGGLWWSVIRLKAPAERPNLHLS